MKLIKFSERDQKHIKNIYTVRSCNINEYKRTEQLNLFESFFISTLTPLVLLDKNFNFIKVNEAYAKICNLNISEFSGHNYFELHPDDEIRSAFKRVVQTKKPLTISAKPFIRVDDHSEKRITYWNWTIVPIPDNRGEVEFLFFLLNDVTEHKKLEYILQEARDYSENIVETVREPLLVLDSNLKVISANKSFYQTFKVTPEETIGQFLYDLGKHQWDIPELRKLLENILPQNTSFEDFEVEYDFPNIGHKIMLLNARQIYRKELGTKKILLAIEDATERKEKERISESLVRVGCELNSLLNTSAILNRLCQLIASELKCDISLTLLWKSEEETYAIVASWGYTPEQRETLQVLRFPSKEISGILLLLEKEDIVAIDLATFHNLLSTVLLQEFGIRTIICMALRRGKEIIGLQIAGNRDNKNNFTTLQKRIAQGIAPIASMALNNAGLFEQVESANRLKSDFLSIVSHELRTPLTSIIGYKDLLLDGACGELTQDQLDAIKHIDKSSKRLLELINSMLNLRHLETRQQPVELKEICITDLIEEIKSEILSLYEKSELNFIWKVEPTLKRFRTDPTKIKMIIKNLISNAVKFTEKGSVTVDIHTLNGEVEINVIDTGIGIPPEALHTIFEPFRQVDNPLTRRHEGIGLGLYIVHRLVDILGGKIKVESKVGSGSTFRVCIPAE